MKIMPVNIISANNHANRNKANTSFGVNSRWVYNELGRPLYKTTTEALRRDLPWQSYINEMCNKYACVDHVNVLIHACSSGLEGISFLLSLLHFRPKDVDKFTPVIARDINKDNIQQAQSGRFEVTKEDIKRINMLTDNHSSDYFSLHIRGDKYYLVPRKEIFSRIIFGQGDIFEDVQRMPNEYSILHDRNMWPYIIKETKRIKLAKLISEQFPNDTSTVVIGNYDYVVNTDKLLNHYGFAESLETPNVFSRPKNLAQYASILY